MTGTLVLDLDEFTATLVRSGVPEVHRLPPGLRLDGLAVPGCRFVVLLPDSGDELGWQEAAHRVVAPFGRPVYADRLTAVAAAAGAGGISGAFPVCDLAAGGLHAGFAEVAENRIRVDHRIREPELGWASFVGAVVRALPGRSGPAVHRALADGGERLAVTLRLAREDAAYGDTPAVWVEGQAVPAGLLLDCLTPYAQRLRSALAELRVPAAEPVLAGEFVGFPLLREFVFDVSGEKPGAFSPGPHAAAHGAVQLASGRFTRQEPLPLPLKLPLHRVRNGLLEEANIPIPVGPGEFASLGERPLRLGAGPGDVPLGDRAELVLEAADGVRRLDLSALPAGSYEVGLRVSRRLGAVLALRAGDGATPVFIPLEART
ncbi:hypothetical protein [Actinocorallia populi]|uniref:hypothetical protein n=1 Tax=Actinocorallia populi TaxID=2079200 RepID=UPI000D08887C|nr:hypothetical protein [Actinocorallia populi]